MTWSKQWLGQVLALFYNMSLLKTGILNRPCSEVRWRVPPSCLHNILMMALFPRQVYQRLPCTSHQLNSLPRLYTTGLHPRQSNQRCHQHVQQTLISLHYRCSSHSISLECLRNTDVKLLDSINSNISTNAFYGTFIFAPVVDGTYITERPSEALRKGKINGVSYAMRTLFEWHYPRL